MSIPTAVAIDAPFEPLVRRILEEATVRAIIPRLKEAGAQGIVEYPLNKVVM